MLWSPHRFPLRVTIRPIDLLSSQSPLRGGWNHALSWRTSKSQIVGRVVWPRPGDRQEGGSGRLGQTQLQMPKMAILSRCLRSGAEFFPFPWPAPPRSTPATPTCKRLHLSFGPSWRARTSGRSKSQIVSGVVLSRPGDRQEGGAVDRDKVSSRCGKWRFCRVFGILELGLSRSPDEPDSVTPLASACI